MGATHSVATHSGSDKAGFELACFTIPPENKAFWGLCIPLVQLHLFITYSVPFTLVHRSENLCSKGKPLQRGGTAQACDPRTWDIEAEGSRVQAQCCLRPGWATGNLSEMRKRTKDIRLLIFQGSTNFFLYQSRHSKAGHTWDPFYFCVLY